MELHKTQAEVVRNKQTYRVVCCGRQWGKTTLAVWEMIANAIIGKDREIAYFATTFDQARNIAWSMLKTFSRNAWSRNPNESRLEIYLRTQDKGESRITLRGFENIETARGQQFDFLVIDEVAFLKNWEYAWNAILEPTLSFRKGRALFISTPTGFNFFKDLFDKGQSSNDVWKSWHFISADNPYLPADRIQQAKENSTPDYFAQEYMADWRRATGLAFKMWDRGIHLIDSFDVPKHWQRGRGFDYGSNDPTATVRVAIDPNDNWFVERCYKSKSQVIEDHAHMIQAQDYGFGFVPIWGDPSGAQWELEFQRHNIHIQSANKEVGQGSRGWVEYGIEVINQRLKPIPGRRVEFPNGKVIENAPRLYVLNTTENQMLVKEMELLKWKETAPGVTLPILDETIDPDGHSDLSAALRYFSVSYKKQEPLYKKNDFTSWRI